MGVSGECKQCKKLYNQDHYAKTKDRWKDTRAEQRESGVLKSQMFLREYLLQHPCVDCGETDLMVLEFDHLPQFQKIKDVTRLIGSNKLLVDEVAKCEVRCANCHRRKTFERSGIGWWRQPDLGGIV